MANPLHERNDFKMGVLLNKEQIKEIIPHRDPFLLIDEVLELEAGKRVVAEKIPC